MAFNIGEKVTTYDGLDGVIADKFESKKNGKTYYTIQLNGKDVEEDDFYEERELRAAIKEDVHYETETEILGNVVVAILYEVKNGERSVITRGHGHILHDGVLGIAQATSYAYRNVLLSINGGNTYIEKE